ncbi:hypothetical protein NHF39_07780 [Pseudomonas proteolytica]|nr:hypothetical protein [Pseudomonas proteolytica]USW96496.1 hypothetical protein NHF39_07780 [Pseudomonas proteolytica]USW99341.1 hypothetical protein NHF41_23535 [Pseudomonas proteolytica]
MTTKKFDSDDKGTKVGGAARVTVYRGGVEERVFTATEIWLFTMAIRIEGDGEWVMLYYPSYPGTGDHEWLPGSNLRGTYTDREGEQSSTFESTVNLKVSENPYQQDGSFNLMFGPELRVTGIFTANGVQ